VTGIAYPPHPSAIAPLELTWARFGDVVEPAGVDGRPEPYFVLHACPRVSKGFFCTTHRIHLVNLGNLAMHLEAGGRHHVAVWCSHDRLYEEPMLEQRAAVGQLQPGDPATDG
jgi:hypothetical protein